MVEVVTSALWQQQLRQASITVEQLCAQLGLVVADLPVLSAPSSFPLRVPPGYVALMEQGNPRDPLLLQVLPLAEEAVKVPGFVDDPLQEEAVTLLPGLLQKYTGRVLVVANGVCAIHCRYCFRRHFPYSEHGLSSVDWSKVVDTIAADRSISEVIFSGGDPLLMKDARLAQWLQDCANIDHIKRVRFHTRLPVVLPARLTPALQSILTTTRLQVVLVMHANHPREISPDVQVVCAAYRAAGIHLLNQSVLLRGVNDQMAVLKELSEALFAAGVQPYYLHQLDPVDGAAHFLVSLADGCAIMRALRHCLPGYLVPQYVQEVPGDGAKRLIDYGCG